MVWHKKESAKTVPAGIWLNSDLAARLHLWGGLTCSLWILAFSFKWSLFKCELMQLWGILWSKATWKKKRRERNRCTLAESRRQLPDVDQLNWYFMVLWLTSAFWYYLSEVYVHVSAVLLDIKVHWESNIFPTFTILQPFLQLCVESENLVEEKWQDFIDERTWS